MKETRDTYKPFDQREHLGEPPWSGPELEAWEQAHGHDVRVKCYPEYGCQTLWTEWERLTDENERLRDGLRHLRRGLVLSGAWDEGSWADLHVKDLLGEHQRVPVTNEQETT